MIGSWILGAEYGTSVATILYGVFTPTGGITQARSGGVIR
jgi:hypothetical protein